MAIVLKEENRRTTGNGHVKMQAEPRVMHIEAKEHQGLQAVTRSCERGMEQTLPQSLRKEPTCPHLDFRLLSS